MKPMWLAQAGDGGWLQRRLAMAEISLSNHIASLAGGSLAHTFGARSFFKARLVYHRPGARAARCPPWRPFVSRLGWSFIVQLLFLGSAGCSWPPWRPAGCTAPPSSFFKARLVLHGAPKRAQGSPLPAPQRAWQRSPPATASHLAPASLSAPNTARFPRPR